MQNLKISLREFDHIKSLVYKVGRDKVESHLCEICPHYSFPEGCGGYRVGFDPLECLHELVCNGHITLERVTELCLR